MNLDAEEHASEHSHDPLPKRALKLDDIREWTLEQVAELVFDDLGPAEATAEQVSLS